MSGSLGRTDRLIPANTTLLQPGSRYYRISDALNAQAAVTNVSNSTLQSQISALTSAVYSQIYSQSEQTTSVTISIPSGFGARIVLRADPGSLAGSSASGYLYRDSTIIGQVGYVNSAGPPTFPSPPNYPWGDIDQPGAGSHTYTMSFYVDPEIAAATGSSNWADYSATANCYLLVQAF